MTNLFAEKLDLAEFPAASLADWQAAAVETLKGKPLDKLTSRTPDGLVVEPIYQSDNHTALPGAKNDPGIFPYVRGARVGADWEAIEGEPALPEGGRLVAAYEVHEAGGTAVQEVAWAWAEGLRLLRGLVESGEGIDSAAARLVFSFGAGGEFFVTIAKLRAARFGWARIVTAAGGSENAARMRIHARTSQWQQSALDPYTNILRSTASAYAAVLGGCDSLTVSPFDDIFREPDEISRRLALNTQRILREECHAAAVADPAGGSWFVENMTRETAEAAWKEFQTSESGSSAPDCLAKSASAQRDTISKRRRVMVGVNQYANPTEKPLPSTKDTTAARLSRDFEQLRSTARAYADKNGGPPKIFLLTMGSLKQHKARADFIRGFFEPGGFDVIYPSGFKTAEDAVAAAKASGALAAVLCSTDETYPELVPAITAAAGSALPVILAGFPAEQVEAFKAAGVADFIHIKADCGAFLAAWQNKLGVAS